MLPSALLVRLAVVVVIVLASPAKSEDASAIDFARQKTIQIAHTLWSDASQPNWEQSRAVKGIQQLMEPLSTLEKPQISNGLEFLYGWARVQAKSHGIESMYDTFKQFMAREKIMPNSERAWLDTAEGMLQDIKTVPEIHRRIAANGTVYNEALKEQLNNVCDSRLSTQMLLYNMYASTQMTFLKAYVMSQSAWLILDAKDKGSFWNDANNMTDMYQELTREQAAMAKEVIAKASRAFWRCDPPKHQKGVTYDQVQGLLQGYLENEVDMNPEGSCRGGCQNYEVAERYGCYKDKFCAVQPACSGRIFNCGFVESDMKVCIPKNESLGRRYEYISYKQGSLLGTARLNQECNMVTVDSWWRFLLPAHCTYCFCQCEESPENSERYFSLGSAQADIDNNKVVTGVRFVKKNRTFYLQIQQAALLPRGGINESTVEWVKINEGGPKFLMSYEKRNLDLDDIQAQPGYVVTGMRFRSLGSHLNPEIMVTPLDFDRGLLRRPEELSYWHGNDNTEHSEHNARKMLILPTADVDMKRGQNEPDSSSNSFVHFGPSSFESDAAQTTIPLIDIQPVVTSPPSILSGAGLYHKGCQYMAGFVAPRIFTYDVTPHIDGSSQMRATDKTDNE